MADDVVSGSWHRSLAAASVGSVAASGSTYLAFILAARSLPTAELAYLAGVSAAAQLLAQVADGGQGARLVRDMASPGSSTLWLIALRRRSTFAAAGAVGAGAFGFTVLELPAPMIVAGALYAMASVWYYLTLLRHQSGNDVRAQVFGQSLNAATTLATAVGVLAVGPSVTGFILSLATGLLLPSFPTVRSIPQALVTRNREYAAERPGDPFAWWLSNNCNMIIYQADSLIVAVGGAVLLARYSLLQRPLQGANALMFAAGSIAVPRMRGWRRDNYARFCKMLPLLTGCGFFVLVAVSLPLAQVLNALYGTTMISAGTVVAFGSGGVAQLAAAFTGAALLHRHASWGVTWGAMAGAAITVCGLLWVAMAAQSLFIAGLVYSSARVATVVLHWVALIGSLRPGAR